MAPLSLAIEAGEKVALMGPSGSGKSTLLGLLSGAIRPDVGQVFLAGTPTTRLRSAKERARLVGVMPQSFDLVPSLAVVHNVLAGRLGEWGLVRSAVSLIAPRELDAAHAALRRVGVEDKLWERASNLSGGEQQRVALARLLLQRPRAILADEPVSAVDPARAEDLLEMLSGIVSESGQALVASMHAVPLALRFFDRVVALRAGRLLFDRPSSAVDPDHLVALYALEHAGGEP
ncbi:MAG TPA: ATP-binding cassette domain-containing protein [Thermomicrobiales bacterium]|nr:ATP-binding cassette domain-containing protein [Thermomicrobiales bacterium]